MEVHLRAKRDSGRKLLVPYVTGGLGWEWLDVLRAMVANGADAVEVGIPFSDPVMDGPTIQLASQRALDGGATPGDILRSLRGMEVGVPVVVMTYYNLAFRAGHERFSHMLADAGVSGIILPDVPLEELDEWQAVATAAGIATALLVAPITPDDRLPHICERAQGFVYGVNLMGVTGERAALSDSSQMLATRIKAVTDKPVIMGFGISTPEQAVSAAKASDGVVVASALMRQMLDGAGPDEIGTAVAAFRAALDTAP